MCDINAQKIILGYMLHSDWLKLFFIEKLVCFTSYFVFSIAVLPHYPG